MTAPFDDHKATDDAINRSFDADDASISIARLSFLDPIAYDQQREAAAAALGIRVATLDAEVEKARRRPDPRHVESEARPPAFTDEALALRFAERHKDDLRFVAAWNRWLILDGPCWRHDRTMLALNLARTICREASAECNDARIASAIASAKTVAAVERLAKADRRIAATVDQWDSDLWLLNTPSGVIDLQTGAMRDHRAEDYMTKVTAVAPDGRCPLWLRTLGRITAGNLELQSFLQRVAGYGLTGITREHALFFGHGTGANGKGTFLNTLTAVMGGYAAVASMETFTASPGDRHPTDLAMLRGARLVSAQETEEGRRWAEARIKALTGGDPVTARFMRQDFFTFVPQFKLFIAGNHKPGLRNVDEAIRRRFNLIPFDVRIPPEERNPNLLDDLKTEWPGILKWMIDGCMEWQQSGLAAPQAVREATDDYLDAEDATAQWLAERCWVRGQIVNGRAINGELYSTSSDLFASWKVWADQTGEFVASQKRFSQGLQSRGFVPRRNRDGRSGFDGIRLIPNQVA
jgi:putative DNA primase/helicase